jgi:TolB protein
MNADGSNQRRLTNLPGLEQQAAWSPDGSRIAFVAEGPERSGILVTRLEGGEPVAITPPGREAGNPVWSPDGKRMAFVMVSDGTIRVMLAELDGGAIRPLTKAGKAERNPVWSPDGKHILYLHSGGRTEGVNIRLAQVETGEVTSITSNPYLNSQAAFSPDGRSIVYLSNADTQGGTMNVHVIHRDGTGANNLTRSETADLAPVWSADGAHVYFMSFRDWPGRIYRMNPDGTGVVRLTHGPAQDSNPAPRPSVAGRNPNSSTTH